MKKAVVTFLSILILLSVFCLIAYSAPVFGDVNSDGSITADDARTVLRASVGLTQLSDEEKIFADMNRDGRITADDARTILRISVDLEPVPTVDNHIYIPSCGMDADYVIGDVTQTAVNENDIVCNLTLMNPDNPLFMGHSYNTFRKLPDIKIGDKIYLTINGETKIYTVTVSEPGSVVDNGTNIQGESTGTKLIYSSPVSTLHLYTCYVFYGRWIVLAELNS